MDAMMKSAVRSIGSTVGRQLIRGVMGSLLGGRQPALKFNRLVELTSRCSGRKPIPPKTGDGFPRSFLFLRSHRN